LCIVGGGVCCGLPFILFSYKRHRLHSETNDDCIAPITYAIIKSTKEEPSTSASVRLISKQQNVMMPNVYKYW